MNKSSRMNKILPFILLTLLLFSCTACADSAEVYIKYIYNPDFHGALLYTYHNSIQGILMNGTEIQSTWVKKYDEGNDRFCIQLPGIGTLLWVNSDELVDQWPEGAESDILTGIVELSTLGKEMLTILDNDLSWQEYLYTNSRVKIAGRIVNYYYLPEVEQHCILMDDILTFTDIKYRRYLPDLLNFIELPRYGEVDGTEHMTKDEVLEIAKNTFQQYFSELPTNGDYKVYLNLEHSYDSLGKTWIVDYSVQDDEGDGPRLFEVEIIDKDREVLTVYSAYEIDMPDYLVKDGITLTEVY